MSQAWRATLFTASLYLLVGATLPYAPVWLEQARGFAGWQIAGAISAATLLRIIVGPVSAAWSEQIGLRSVLIAISAILTIGYALLLFAPMAALIIALIIAVYLAWGAAMPLSEALLMSATRSKRPDYGVARAIGSAAFIAASLAVGALVRTHGSDIAVIWMAAASGLMVISAAWMKPDRPALVTARPSLATTLREGGALYRDRRILLAALAAALIQSAHAQYYNFGSILWIAQGIDETQVGILWSVGVLAEIVFLAVSGVMLKGKTVTPGTLIMLGGAGAVVRWTLTGFAPSLTALYALQTLHALSFAATLVGTLRFLEEELAPEKVPIAVSINSALGFGPLLAGAGVIGGILFDALDTAGPQAQAQSYWLMAAMAAIGLVLCIPLLRRRQPQSAGLGGETRAPS
ncbi:MAG: MFS transporter [Pseudomonadota bacterium]